MAARLGARNYSVLLVRTQWSGGTRGVGYESVIEERFLLPVPAVADISAGVQHELLAVGTEEVGSLQVTEISVRYTESDLLGLSPDGDPIPADQSFYWEVRDDGASVADTPRRRFVPVSAPYRDREGLQWIVRLRRVRGDRTRMGEPQ